MQGHFGLVTLPIKSLDFLFEFIFLLNFKNLMLKIVLDKIQLLLN